jgi:hypothetical protein
MGRILQRLVRRHWERVDARALKARKKIHQLFGLSDFAGKRGVLFIIGCQRSGTTLMTDIFDRDLHTVVYGEFSTLSSFDLQYGLRLNPLPLVRAQIDRDKVPLVVLKPLVETQNAPKLLDYFGDSRALWMYRNYRDVASSNLAAFGPENGIRNLRAIVENAPQNWRSENVPEETREIVLRHFSEDMNPHDAAALFWLVRNRLFFELGLDRHLRVTMCKYENLLADPKGMIHAVYRFIGIDYPSDRILTSVRPDAGRGADIKLSLEVDSLCTELLDRLNEAYATRSVAVVAADRSCISMMNARPSPPAFSTSATRSGSRRAPASSAP